MLSGKKFGHYKSIKVFIDDHKALLAYCMITALVFLTYYILTLFDAFEEIYEFSRKYEDYEIDEIFTFFLVSSFGLIIAFFIRSKELKYEVNQRNVVEKSLSKLSQELWETNQELEQKAEQLQDLLKQEKEFSELQRSFVSMASHEFRTPLAIIDNNAQRIIRKADKLPTETITEKLKTIRAAVKRMTSLMESTLCAAKMEAGKISCDFKSCDVKGILEECCLEQQEISPKHNIQVNIKDMPASIMADEGALNQIFANLLSNAVKYSPDSPDVDVAAWEDDGHVFITIKDSGRGIDAEDIPKIFKRFFRAKTSVGIVGTGIGLNLIKMLIEQHHGTISFESEKGVGTKFIVSLPIKQELSNVNHDEIEHMDVA